MHRDSFSTMFQQRSKKRLWTSKPRCKASFSAAAAANLALRSFTSVSCLSCAASLSLTEASALLCASSACAKSATDTQQ